MKTHLGKIGASTENSSAEKVLVSRTAKLVLAAANKTPNYRPPMPRVPAAMRTPVHKPSSSSSSLDISDGPAAESSTDTGTPKASGSSTSKPPGLLKSAAKENKQPFEDEVMEFHQSLHLTQEEIDNLAFSDLRHRMERIKCRKLSKEEGKKFLQLAQVFIDSYMTELMRREKQAKKQREH